MQNRALRKWRKPILPEWKPDELRIAVNMASAVSAGAYTFGIPDFMVEAFEEWQKAKDIFRAHLSGPNAGLTVFPNPMPLQDVSIEAFCGCFGGRDVCGHRFDHGAKQIPAHY
jgi:hypothetical protein